MSRAITILGMGPTANERKIDILKYCEGTDIWSLNNAYLNFPHIRDNFARFFELHKWDYLKTWDAGGGEGSDHFKALDTLPCPVWVTNPIPVVRNQERYDLLEVMDHFETNYFLGSPSLMLALAIYEHDKGDTIKEIRSWGIDTSDPSHGQQRTSWAFWLSKAMDRGIKMTGSSINFFSEYENDDGLRGLREEVGEQILNRRREAAESQPGDIK